MYDYDGSLSIFHFLGGRGVLISLFHFYPIIRRGLRYAMVVRMICIIIYFFYDFCLFLFHPIIRRGARLAEVICPHQQILLLLHGIQDRLYTPKAEKKKACANKDIFSIVGRTDYNVFFLMAAPIKMFPHFDKAIARNAGPSV